MAPRGPLHPLQEQAGKAGAAGCARRWRGFTEPSLGNRGREGMLMGGVAHGRPEEELWGETDGGREGVQEAVTL